MKNRVVLLSRAEIEPDPPQTVRRAQFRACDMAVVVPEQPAMPGWMIDRHRGEQQCSHSDPGRPTGRLRFIRLPRRSCVFLFFALSPHDSDAVACFHQNTDVNRVSTGNTTTAEFTCARW